MTVKPRVPVGVGLLLVDKEGRILLHRRKGSHGAGKWGFPGGAVDPGETPLDAVYRELQEEAGIEQPTRGLAAIDVLYDKPWVNSIHAGVDAGQQWVTLFFVAAHDGQEPRVMEPEKNDEWKWWDLRDLPYEDLFLPLQQIHGFLMAYRTTHGFVMCHERALQIAKSTTP